MRTTYIHGPYIGATIYYLAKNKRGPATPTAGTATSVAVPMRAKERRGADRGERRSVAVRGGATAANQMRSPGYAISLAGFNGQ